MKDMNSRIKKELIRRFEANGWSKLTLHMKASGDNIVIDPYHLFATEHTATTVQYFFIESPSIFNAGEETLNDVVNFIAHYDEKRQESFQRRNDVQWYYRNYIQGKPVQMLMDGNTYIDAIMRQYDAENSEHSFETFDAFMQSTDLNTVITDGHDEEYIRQAIALANAAECYSDSYKSIYGHRPAIDDNNDGIL